MDTYPPFDTHDLASIAQILGNSDEGLTPTQIAALLREAHIPDVTPEIPRWQRLFNAFVALQNTDGSSNKVVAFVERAMNPVKYTWAPRTFARRRDQLNPVLGARGIAIGEDGSIR